VTGYITHALAKHVQLWNPEKLALYQRTGEASLDKYGLVLHPRYFTHLPTDKKLAWITSTWEHYDDRTRKLGGLLLGYDVFKNSSIRVEGEALHHLVVCKHIAHPQHTSNDIGREQLVRGIAYARHLRRKPIMVALRTSTEKNAREHYSEVGEILQNRHRMQWTHLPPHAYSDDPLNPFHVMLFWSPDFKTFDPLEIAKKESKEEKSVFPKKADLEQIVAV
jgi:hypothetical protein